MNPVQQRVVELLDRWLASLELHIKYGSLTDEAYWQVQPWPQHQRPARWIIDLALRRAQELKQQLDTRIAANDAGFIEGLELMAFLANLVGAQNIERFIPLAEPERENREALGQTQSTLKPLTDTSTQTRALLETTREMRTAVAAPSVDAAPPSPPKPPALRPQPDPRPASSAMPARPPPPVGSAAAPVLSAPSERPAVAAATPASVAAGTTAIEARVSELSPADASGPPLPAEPREGAAPRKAPPPPVESAAAPPSRPAPPTARTATAPRSGAKRESRSASGKHAKPPAPGSPEAQIFADAVRLLKWGREWHELPESIARIAGRPSIVQVRKFLRSFKTEIEKTAAAD